MEKAYLMFRVSSFAFESFGSEGIYRMITFEGVRANRAKNTYNHRLTSGDRSFFCLTLDLAVRLILTGSVKLQTNFKRN